MPSTGPDGLLEPRVHGRLALEAAAEGVDREAAVHHARQTLAVADAPSTAGTSAGPEAILVLAIADLAEEARRAIDAWLELARTRASPRGVVLGSAVAALAALYRGAMSDAVALARGATAPGCETWLEPVAVAVLVEALIERGELDLALAKLGDRGLDGDLAHGWATTPLLLARGRLHAAAGRHRAAVGDVLESGRRAEALGVRNPAMMPWRSSAAVSLAAAGERDRAIALADEEVELARRWGTTRALGVALRAAGAARAGDEAIVQLREAAAVLAVSPGPIEHARALVDLGAALRRAGRRREARDRLGQGLEVAARLGAAALAARAREELIATK